MILCYINFTAIFKAIEERLYFLINKKHSNSFNNLKKTRKGNKKWERRKNRRWIGERKKIKPQRGVKKTQITKKTGHALILGRCLPCSGAPLCPRGQGGGVTFALPSPKLEGPSFASVTYNLNLCNLASSVLLSLKLSNKLSLIIWVLGSEIFLCWSQEPRSNFTTSNTSKEVSIFRPSTTAWKRPHSNEDRVPWTVLKSPHKSPAERKNKQTKTTQRTGQR